MGISTSLLIALCSYIRIPLFFTPVPLVIQNALAVAIGALLGSKKGGLSVLLFLVYGCCSLPVFSGGRVGLSALLYPSPYSLALLVGFLAILLSGTSFLALTIGWEKAFYLGFLPFIVPDILKAAALAKMLTVLQKR